MKQVDEIFSGNYPRVVIAGSHGSAGKTTFTVGLIRALTNRNFSVQPFKKGPDFIDPLWHTAASGRTCRNLDFFMMKENIRTSFIRNATGASISIIEGNKGLFDGLDTEGSDSTSALARHLEAPILLVVDCYKMTRGIAPLIQGYLNFEKDLNIFIILNNVSGKRHEQKLRDAISHYTDAEVIGVIYRDSALEIDERHLGLVPSNELKNSPNIIEKLAESVAANVDLGRIVEIANTEVPSFLATSISYKPSIAEEKTVRIGIAKDRAFTFYYPENLEALERAGAQLIPFSPLEDEIPPDVDAFYFGGGFPEMHMETLSENRTMIREIQNRIQEGIPVYAECGGLMYLSRSIKKSNQKFPMLDALPMDTEVSVKPHGKGYMIFRTSGNSSGDFWHIPAGLEVRAHEFHYSYITNFENSLNYAYDVIRGSGMDGKHDGIVMKNIFASYVHLHAYAAPWWAEMFVNSAKFFKKNFKKSVIQSKAVFALPG